jgi:hypothetical protein
MKGEREHEGMADKDERFGRSIAYDRGGRRSSASIHGVSAGMPVSTSATIPTEP